MLFVVDYQVLERSSTDCVPLIADGIENDINPRKHSPHIELKH
jgi:hypothetical protein